MALEETRALIREGAEAIRNDLQAGDICKDGFQKFRRGIVRAQSGNGAAPGTVMDEVVEKAAVIASLVVLGSRHKIFCKQISYTLRMLLEGSSAWVEAWRSAPLPPDLDTEALLGFPRREAAAPAEAPAGNEAAGTVPYVGPQEPPEAAEEEEAGSQETAEELAAAELRGGLAELVELNFNAASRRAPVAFRRICRGLAANGADVVLDTFERKAEALHFLLELHGLKKLYRHKVARCVADVLKRPAWSATCLADGELRALLEDELQLQLLAEGAADGGGGDPAAFREAGRALLRQVALMQGAARAFARGPEGEAVDVPGTAAASRTCVAAEGAVSGAAQGCAAEECGAAEAVAEARTEAEGRLKVLAAEELPEALAGAGLSEEDFEEALSDYVAAYLNVADKLVQRGERTWPSMASAAEGLDLVDPKLFARWRARMRT